MIRFSFRVEVMASILGGLVTRASQRWWEELPVGINWAVPRLWDKERSISPLSTIRADSPEPEVIQGPRERCQKVSNECLTVPTYYTIVLW